MTGTKPDRTDGKVVNLASEAARIHRKRYRALGVPQTGWAAYVKRGKVKEFHLTWLRDGKLYDLFEGSAQEVANREPPLPGNQPVHLCAEWPFELGRVRRLDSKLARVLAQCP